MNKPLRIGTRDSAFGPVADCNSRTFGIGYGVDFSFFKSRAILTYSNLYAMGVTGIFTKALDSALLNQEIDLVIHSMKDVPTQFLKLCKLLCWSVGQLKMLSCGNTTAKEKDHRVIATGSLRRKAQWQSKYLR